MDLEVSEVSIFLLPPFYQKPVLDACPPSGGLRYLRYGSLRGNILGVEAVLADGQARLLMAETWKNAMFQ